MRRFIVASLLLVSTAVAACAADLPRSSYAPPPPFAPAPSGWSGLYLGGNFGGGITTANSDFSVGGTPIGTINNSLSGAVGGAQAGFNWQYGPAVMGIETDIQYSGMAGTLSAPCGTPFCLVPTSASFSQKMPWFGTVRARFGYAANSWLVYATGGYAYAEIDTDASAAAPGFAATFTRHEIRNGWTAGGGIEVALNPKWTAKLEYLYLDFGRVDNPWVLNVLPTIDDNARIVSSVVRAGLNYRF
jgi:outer membrane immunogenic protein